MYIIQTIQSGLEGVWSIHYGLQTICITKRFRYVLRFGFINLLMISNLCHTPIYESAPPYVIRVEAIPSSRSKICYQSAIGQFLNSWIFSSRDTIFKKIFSYKVLILSELERRLIQVQVSPRLLGTNVMGVHSLVDRCES